MRRVVGYQPAALLAALAAKQGPLVGREPVAGSRCDACGKVLEETEAGIKGYASGFELGLCRRCASDVNTPAAITHAEQLGVKVHSRPVLRPSGPSPVIQEAEND